MELNEAIHITGIYFIRKGEFNNMEIIKFIQEDSIIYYEDYESEKVLAYLIGYISFDEIDDKFCYAFIFNNDSNTYYDYAGLYKKNYVLFLESLTKGITHFRNLPTLYKLLRIKDNPHQQDHVVVLLKTFITKNLKRNDLNIEDLSGIIGPLFKLISDNENKYKNHLMVSIRKMFIEYEVNVLFMYIINNFGNQLNHELIQEMFENEDYAIK
ncbi:hypothetical protein PIROE2DRAFT_61161 [Piromyces sp. E2]|nr:hypothetical protein PIROE2DRAFT_61161 [Piromyces sp. E2]|eukprot:OUM63629.1 hypothetical protein PIROE2DRAFT_61161 [Piromyces sp. E2]